MDKVTNLFKKWTDFEFDATACYSIDPTKRVGNGEHKIICTRGFPGSYSAHNYAMDEIEKLQWNADGSRPEKIDYRGADSHYDWRSLSDTQLKRNISRKTGAKESQIIIKPRI